MGSCISAQSKENDDCISIVRSRERTRVKVDRGVTPKERRGDKGVYALYKDKEGVKGKQRQGKGTSLQVRTASISPQVEEGCEKFFQVKGNDIMYHVPLLTDPFVDSMICRRRRKWKGDELFNLNSSY